MPKQILDISPNKPKTTIMPKTRKAPIFDGDIDTRDRSGASDSRVLMSWDAREFVKYEKSKAWYLAIGLLFAAALVYAILTKGYIMAITFVMLGIIVYMFSVKEPRTIKFAITEDGIKIDDKFYYYDDLESFWIIYKPPYVKTLNFRHSKLLIPEISIQLEDQDPVQVRELLLDNIPEDINREESTVDILARKLKF